MPTWPTILAFLERDGTAALVTVVEAKGSTPRDEGARMMVRADGAFSGTIGGGTLEWLALAEAQKVLRGGPPSATMDKALGPDLGQCCGGRAVISIERFDAQDRAWIAPLAAAEKDGPIETIAEPDARGVWVRRLIVDAERAPPDPSPGRGGWPSEARTGGASAADATPPVRASGAATLPMLGRDAPSPAPRSGSGARHERFGDVLTPVLLFGAGHVGRALALALAPLPFRVTWIDDRPDAFPLHVPGNAICLAAADPAPVLAAAAEGSLVAVMTHSHALDLAVVAAALPDARFPFVGLIGSRTKRARFARQLTDIGHPPEVVGRLVCPIGLLAIGGKEPAVIAAGIAAQLLIERERAQGVIASPRGAIAGEGKVRKLGGKP